MSSMPLPALLKQKEENYRNMIETIMTKGIYTDLPDLNHVN